MKVHVKMGPVSVQRPVPCATFAPGDPMAVSIGGCRLLSEWVDGVEGDPGLSVWQAETLRDLCNEGVTLEIGDDGVLSVVEI